MAIDKEKQQAEVTEATKEPTGFGRKKIAMIAGAVTLGVVLLAGGAYAVKGQAYRQVFFPNTTINGLNASGLTPEQVKELIDSGMDGYLLTLETRGGAEETISGDAIDLHPEYDGTLEEILAGQQPLRWGLHLTEGSQYTIGTMMAYDSEKLQNAVSGLACMDPAQMEAPGDARMSEYITGSGYEIIPETQGNTPDSERVLQGVSEAILNLKSRISLEELDVYQKPAVTADDEAIKARVEAWNRYVKTTVTYRFGSDTEVLDGETLHTWLADSGTGLPQLREEPIAEYVSALAKKYNTAYQAKQLKTSYGPVVTIDRGNYGWRINQSAETAALMQILQSGESQEREPVYSQTAASRGSHDYGDTYVEINLTAQHLYFYKNGNLLVESDFVSGNESKGWSTPAGAYPLTYKQRDATLKGEGYATPVSYWMPFNGGIGMHDANWRYSFGGNIYKTNGSHGCINLPPSVAKVIYENISAGMPVLCYHLSGTGKGSTTAAPAETTAPAEPADSPTEGSGAPAESGATPTEHAEALPEGSASQPEGNTAQAEGSGAQPGESTASQNGSASGNGAPSETPGPGAESTAAVPETSPATGGTTPQPGVSPSPTPEAPPSQTAARPQVQDTPGTQTTPTPNQAGGPGAAANQNDTGAVEGPGM